MTRTSDGKGSVVTDEQINEQPTPGEGTTGDRGPDPQYGIGPFSIRETVLGGVWFVAFVVSFFSLSTLGFASVWTSGLLWILTIGVPTLAVFLLALRRLSPQGIRRFGSLGIDQFASVAFSVSAVLWVQLTWETIAVAVENGVLVRSWVLWVEVTLALAGVVLTVVAPHLPVLGEDFVARAEAGAHRIARAPRPIEPRPQPAPVPAAPVPVDDPKTPSTAEPAVEPLPDERATSPETAITEVFGALDVSTEDASVQESEPEPEPEPEVVRQEAFWVLAPEERIVHDEAGAPVFVIGPTAWALVVEDRDAVFVIRHEDGRIGYLHDVAGMTRG